MNVKVLIAILVLLVLLLAAGIGVGATGDEDQGLIGGGWVEGLGELLVRGQPLSPDDVVGAEPLRCRRELREGLVRIAAGERCTLDVGKSSAPQRQLRLRLVAGQAVTVLVDHVAEDRLTERSTLSPGKKAETRIYLSTEGGRIELGCLALGSGQPCQVQVVK